MYSFQKIKRKNLDLEKYSKAIQQALNYRVYAEYWYLDTLTDEKWECWVWDDYEAVMPVPLQYKFGFKFVLQPTYCQQLGVFYKEEIPEELFREFEKILHKYRVRSYCFNEENTEKYNPTGEKKVNYVLDLGSSYEEIYKSYRKDRKKNIQKGIAENIEINETIEIEKYFELIDKYYPNVHRPSKRLLQNLSERNLLLQYTATVDENLNNHRIFLVAKNRVFVLASARNKDSKVDLSSSLIDLIIQKYSLSDKILDFEGSMIKGVAKFNEGFGAIKKIYTCFSNFNFNRNLMASHILFKVIFLLIMAIPLSAQKKVPEYLDYPFVPTYKPLAIRANMVILYRNDGTGNFDLKDPEQFELLKDYAQRVNYIYANLGPAADKINCQDSEDFFPDTGFRIEYNYVSIKNEFAWNYMNTGGDPDNQKLMGFSPSENWYIKSLDDSISTAKNIPKGINVYLTTNGEKFDVIEKNKSKEFDLNQNAAAQHPSEKNIQRSSQVHLPNRYLKYLLHKYQSPTEYNTTWETTREWHLQDAKGIAHEFGHNFGLSHTNKCPNALMKQGIRKEKYFISQSEIKKMHWNLTRTNLMQFVTEESHYGVSWLIENDTTWDKPRRFYNDFEIAKNVTLTISDSIVLPPQATIKLNKKSKIIFTGKGKIVNAFGEEFSNFQKHRTAAILRD